MLLSKPIDARFNKIEETNSKIKYQTISSNQDMESDKESNSRTNRDINQVVTPSKIEDKIARTDE